jgi:hypothetical protein
MSQAGGSSQKKQKFKPTTGAALPTKSRVVTTMLEIQAAQEAEHEAQAAAAAAAAHVPASSIEHDAVISASAALLSAAAHPTDTSAAAAPPPSSAAAAAAAASAPPSAADSQRALIRQAQEEHERKARLKKQSQLHRQRMQEQQLAKKHAKEVEKKTGVKVKARVRKVQFDVDDLPPAKSRAVARRRDSAGGSGTNDDGDDDDQSSLAASTSESQVPVSNADRAAESSRSGAPREESKPKRPIPSLTPAQLVKQNASVGDIVRSGFERDRQTAAKAKSTAVAAAGKGASRTDTHSAADRVHQRMLASQAAAAPVAVAAPQVKIKDGKFQVAPMQAAVPGLAAAAAAAADAAEASSAHALGGRVTYASFTKRAKAEKWSTPETDRFFAALRQFGTDFSLIEKLFANRSRRQIKSKFKKEESLNRERVDEALKARLPIDTQTFREKLSAEQKALGAASTLPTTAVPVTVAVPAAAVPAAAAPASPIETSASRAPAADASSASAPKKRRIK